MNINDGIVLSKGEYRDLLEKAAVVEILKRVLANGRTRLTNEELKTMLDLAEAPTEKVEAEVVEEKKEVDVI